MSEGPCLSAWVPVRLFQLGQGEGKLLLSLGSGFGCKGEEGDWALKLPSLLQKTTGYPSCQPPPALLLQPSLFPLLLDSEAWMLGHRAVVQRAAGRGRGQGALWQEASRTSWPFQGQNKFSLGFRKDKGSKLPLLCRMKRTNHEPELGCRLTASTTAVSSSSCQELTGRGKKPRGGCVPLEGAQRGRRSSGTAWGRQSGESWGRAWTGLYIPARGGKTWVTGAMWVCVRESLCVRARYCPSRKRPISDHRSATKEREVQGLIGGIGLIRQPPPSSSALGSRFLRLGDYKALCTGTVW